MRATLPFLVLISTLFAGCLSSGKVLELPPLENVTRIEVYFSNAGVPFKTIEDQEQVYEVVVFANARRLGWEVPLAGVPVPGIRVRFFGGSTALGALGVGSNFFETSRGCIFCSRSATAEEVQEFLSLIEIDPKYLEHKHRREFISRHRYPPAIFEMPIGHVPEIDSGANDEESSTESAQ